MNTKRLFGRLAAATLFVTAFATASQAQIQPHRVPAYTGKAQARPVRSTPSYSSSSSATDGVKFGIRAGVNVSDWSGDAVNSVMDLADYTNGAVTKDMKTGFHAGLYATLPLGPRFAIEPGVGYSEKGTVLTGRIPLEQFDFLNAKVKATARMAYLDIPLLAKAYLTDGFYVFAGPQASVLLSGKARVNASALGFSAFNEDFDIKDQFRPVDFSVTGGLGYQFQNGLGLSAGYDYGLSSLDKNNNFDAQNRVIKASVNYSF
ncbi:PorT family protein [Hymenobacter sp. HSC-4F20]|uniref:porin family protein n=1 Tax=Hymenobacter sp. HSC-4F20 TaxID=2864135 RepID=UPI001C736C9F|nr:porin family protein [Hymenobacter sp. HSC-4F20]MBX0291790.1 PorT family protein [Hymenobacter sp. HSC-4F20]